METGVRQGIVGDRLRRLREATGMSQAVLADKLNVSARTIWSYEHGSSQLDADELPRVAALLGVQPTAFYEPIEAFIETCLGVHRARLELVKIMSLSSTRNDIDPLQLDLLGVVAPLSARRLPSAIPSLAVS